MLTQADVDSLIEHLDQFAEKIAATPEKQLDDDVLSEVLELIDDLKRSLEAIE